MAGVKRDSVYVTVSRFTINLFGGEYTWRKKCWTLMDS